MGQARVLAFAGSARRESFNRRLVAVAAKEAEAAGAKVTLINLADYPLPIMDEDLEKAEGLPANGQKLKDLFNAHNALLIACPEYNSSITPLLKNVIDWVSRPHPNEKPLGCFLGKTAGLLSASGGALGGLRGLVHVRAILSNIQVTVLPDQFALSKAHEAFAPDGSLKDEGQLKAVRNVATRLAHVAGRLDG